MGSDPPPLSELRRAQNRAPDQIPTVYNLTPDQSELSRAVDDEPSRRRAEPTASRADDCLSVYPPSTSGPSQLLRRAESGRERVGG